MKILALERALATTEGDAFAQHLKDEAAAVWRLHQRDVLREIYFRDDRHEAVLVLECADPSEARSILADLPLVREGLIEFEVIPLAPYPGLARLFV